MIGSSEDASFFWGGGGVDEEYILRPLYFSIQFFVVVVDRSSRLVSIDYFLIQKSVFACNSDAIMIK